MECSTQPGFPAHRDCANFRNGLCTLNGVAVNPNGAACPKSTPKSLMVTPQVTRAYPGARQSYQPHPPQIIKSYPSNMSPPTPSPQIGYSLPPPYVYPLWTGYGTATLRHNTAAGTAIPLQPRPDKVVQVSSSCRAVVEAEVAELVTVGEGWVGLR